MYVVKIKHFGFIFSSRNAGLKKSNRFIAFNQKSRVFFLDSAKKTVCFNNVQKVFNLPNLCWAQFCVFVAAYKLRLKTSSNRLGPKKKNHLPVPSICMGHSLVLKRGCVLQFGCWQQFFTGGATHVGVCYLQRTQRVVTVSVLERASRREYFSSVYRGLTCREMARFNKTTHFFRDDTAHTLKHQDAACPLDPPWWIWFSGFSADSCNTFLGIAISEKWMCFCHVFSIADSWQQIFPRIFFSSSKASPGVFSVQISWCPSF